jgi:hypothetical protein
MATCSKATRWPRTQRPSLLAKDISEVMVISACEPKAPNLKVAYHAACSLQHGQQIKTHPKTLLAKAGFTVLEPADPHLCCGSAGTYNMMQPEISKQLKDRKVKTLEALTPDVIAAGNIGCMMQIGGGTGVPVVHTAELLDWATASIEEGCFVLEAFRAVRMLSCNVVQGSSGAPVLRMTGTGPEIVAVISATATDRTGRDVSMAVALEGPFAGLLDRLERGVRDDARGTLRSGLPTVRGTDGGRSGLGARFIRP